MTRRALIIAGLIRRAENFEKFLEELFPLAADHRIEVVVSTWHGELEKYPSIREALSHSDCTVIEQDEPDCILPGHMLHQAVALESGLSVLDDGVFVQRLRPDFADIADVRAFAALEPVRLRGDIRLRHPFRYRLHVNANILAHPFYVNDMCFVGMAGDLRHLTRIPFVYMTKYMRMAPEQLLWGTPIVVQNPVFDHYFRTNVGLIFDDEAAAKAAIECMKRSEIYVKALAAYIHLLSRAFDNLRSKPDFEVTVEQCEEFTVEQILWGNLDRPWSRFHVTTSTTHIHDMNVANALALGRYRDSEFGDRFRAALRAVEQDEPEFFSTRDEIDTLIAQSNDLADGFEAAVNIKGFKVIRQADGIRQIKGMRPHWQIVGQRTDRESELEREINMLRRTVDDLTRRSRA